MEILTSVTLAVSLAALAVSLFVLKKVMGLLGQREQPRPKAISANNGRYGRMMTNGNLSRNTLKSSKKTALAPSV